MWTKRTLLCFLSKVLLISSVCCVLTLHTFSPGFSFFGSSPSSPLAPPTPHHAGSLCSGLFSASALGVSSSAPNLRDYVHTHHLHHRKPPLSPGSQTGVFGMFVLLLQPPAGGAVSASQSSVFLLHLVLHSGTLISRLCRCRSSHLQSRCLILLVMVMVMVLVMKAQIS